MYPNSYLLIKSCVEPKFRKMQDMDENVIIKSKSIKKKCLPFRNRQIPVGSGAHVFRIKANASLDKRYGGTVINEYINAVCLG